MWNCVDPGVIYSLGRGIAHNITPMIVKLELQKVIIRFNTKSNSKNRNTQWKEVTFGVSLDHQQEEVKKSWIRIVCFPVQWKATSYANDSLMI